MSSADHGMCRTFLPLSVLMQEEPQRSHQPSTKHAHLSITNSIYTLSTLPLSSPSRVRRCGRRSMTTMTRMGAFSTSTLISSAKQWDSMLILTTTKIVTLHGVGLMPLQSLGGTMVGCLISQTWRPPSLLDLGICSLLGKGCQGQGILSLYMGQPIDTSEQNILLLEPPIGIQNLSTTHHPNQQRERRRRRVELQGQPRKGGWWRRRLNLEQRKRRQGWNLTPLLIDGITLFSISM